MRKLILLLTTFVLCSHAFAQTPTLQQKLYYTCKVWGFVKYYHSNVNTCNVNWDSVLLSVLPKVESASTKDEFNNALDTMLAAAGTMALSTTYFPDTLAPDLKRNRDFSWLGDTVFRSDVHTILDTIKNNFRPHPICWVEINPSSTTDFSSPWGDYLEFPYDTTLLNVTTAVSYPDVNHRLLMLFKFWNIIRYFNPYNYVLDNPWDTTLYNYVLPIANVGDSRSLYYLCLKITATLDDAHVYAFTYDLGYYYSPPGFYQPNIRLKYMDSQYVVISSLESGIYPGDAVISIDGLTTAQWEDSLKPYYSAGNNSVFRRMVWENMLSREVLGTPETIVIEDSVGIEHTFSLTCSANPISDYSFFYSTYYPTDSLDNILWTTMPCDIGYVNMGNLQDSNVAEMYNDLKTKSAIIFDLRNYPNGTEGQICNLMYPYEIPVFRYMFPDTAYPGTDYWQYYSNGVMGNPNAYTGKVIILMNEETQSQAEGACMEIAAMPGAIKVGSQTAGADGSVVWFSLSDDIHFGYTSLGVFYPNGDSTQRIGIIPDSVVYPTKAGIRHGDDEVLNKALEIAGCNLYVKNITPAKPSVKVFPNPVYDEVTIEASNINAQEVTINISDVTGRTLLQKTIENNNSVLYTSYDIKELSAGMYFVNLKTGAQQYVTKIVKK